MPVVLQRNPGNSRATLQDLLESSRLDTLLVVVPTKRRIRHLTREVLDLAREGVSPALPIYTLESLVTSIVQASPLAVRLINGRLQTLLFEQALDSTRDRLGYFAPRARERKFFQGTFDRIVDVVNTLKEAGVYPDLLEEEAVEAPLDERQKLLDVATIYRAYDAELELARATDMGGIHRFIHVGCSQKEFEGLFRQVFPAVETLSLAGFDEFTAPEISFIKKLSSISGVSMTMLFDFQHGNPALFGHLEDNYRRLIDIGFREDPLRDQASVLSVSPRPRPPEVSLAIDHLSESLFHAGPPQQRTDCSARVTVVRTENRWREIEWICKRIKKLAADDPGIDLSTICVAMVRPQSYTEIVREQFRRFGIPVNITDRYELHRSPLVVSIMGLFQVAVQGFRREDLLRILESPYLGLKISPLSVDAANLYNVSQRLRLGAGYRSWTRRITARLEVVQGKLSAGHAGAGRSAMEREVRSLKKALDDLARIQAAIGPLLGEYSPGQFLEKLESLLGMLRLSQRLFLREDAEGGVEHVERDVRAYARFVEVAREMVDLLSLQGGTTGHPLRYYLDRLKLMISRERYNIREEFGRGVLVTSIDETRGLSMESMFIAGLVDGEFPSVYRPEVFLSSGRQKLREQRHNWQNRYLFYQAVTNWSTRLYLTYPDREGEMELVRSPFIDALTKVVEVTECDASDRMSLPELLCAEDEALRWIAKGGVGAEVPLQRISTKLEEVRRVAAIEKSRMGDHALAEYEGMVFGALPEDLQANLAAHHNATFSVSQLETYAACPFKFFAERVLALQVKEEFREELTPLERGSLLHEALFSFYTARRELDQPPLWRCTGEEFERASGELARIVNERLSSLDIPDAFWEIDKQALLGRPGGTPGVLQEFLQREREREVEPAPEFFEVAFGGPPGMVFDAGLSQEEPVSVGRIRLKGKMDRIDLAADHFTIIDYKTGTKLPTSSDIRNGVSLQLPLYLLVAQRLLAEGGSPGRAPAGALHYRLKSPVLVRAALGNAEFKQRAFDSHDGRRNISQSAEEMQSVMDRSLSAAEGYVDGIAGGRFPLVDAG
ncbi:MAG: PD-(D/E)XK nuclease family protein, partial [Bacteroidota bacterium]